MKNCRRKFNRRKCDQNLLSNDNYISNFGEERRITPDRRICNITVTEEPMTNDYLKNFRERYNKKNS